VDGHIGQQSVGRIPIRHIAERGYRPGWDPQHQWDGLIPFEAMPRLADIERGFVVTANNRLAPDDYPYPLSGTWSGGHRARRIRERLEGKPRWSPEDCCGLQQDVRSGRAAACVPPLVALLTGDADARVRQAIDILAAWDFQLTPDSVAGSIFNAFFVHWCRAAAAERLTGAAAELAAASGGGLATALLIADDAGWFERSDRRGAIRSALVAALDELTGRLGPVMTTWTWGRLHTLVHKHFLSGRGDLGELLDRGGVPVKGDVTTVCSTTPDVNYAAVLGAGYRMVADLADGRGSMRAVEIAGASGHPGSPHYDDQIATWTAGAYHEIRLNDPAARAEDRVLVLEGGQR
jgi:penicillin amidase